MLRDDLGELFERMSQEFMHDGLNYRAQSKAAAVLPLPPSSLNCRCVFTPLTFDKADWSKP
jgi:hypothetical protein